ncbi:hypothetical protein EYF80_013807 [Liparis tanakae]|uniref:Uncharacterized protein n=1 Tax=Liparis tanakae TaxID=230148 RepID=A0A4Z2IF14_9TELE|nr:hypothetical protein EYF80_013807 [Liparis tanakae]
MMNPHDLDEPLAFPILEFKSSRSSRGHGDSLWTSNETAGSSCSPLSITMLGCVSWVSEETVECVEGVAPKCAPPSTESSMGVPSRFSPSLMVTCTSSGVTPISLLCSDGDFLLIRSYVLSGFSGNVSLS